MARRFLTKQFLSLALSQIRRRRGPDEDYKRQQRSCLREMDRLRSVVYEATFEAARERIEADTRRFDDAFLALHWIFERRPDLGTRTDANSDVWFIKIESTPE